MALQVARQIGLVLSTGCQAQHWLRSGFGKVDKVRSVLGVCYKPDLHYALGHMRRWDGAYEPLANVAKAVDLTCDDCGRQSKVRYVSMTVRI